MRPATDADSVRDRALVWARSIARKSSRQTGWARWRQVCAGLAFAAACAGIAQDGQRANSATGDSAAAASTAPASPQAESKPGKREAALAAEEQRKKQISAESTQLLAMAVALKAEVDKTNKDVLSINVIRKADEIERLAHNVKEKIKQTAGPR